MAVVDTAATKTALAITGSGQDAQIAALITHCQDFIDDYCNYAYSSNWDDGLNLILVKMIGFLLQNPSGLSSERIGDYSYTLAGTDWPKAVLDGLKSFRWVEHV